MKKNSLTDNFSELSDVVKKYIEARIALFKAVLLEKLTRIGTYFLTVVLSVIIFACILLLLTLAFSFWYGNTIGSIYEGLLISAAFYAVLGIIVFIFRRFIFSNSIVRNVGSILFADDEKDDQELN